MSSYRLSAWAFVCGVVVVPALLATTGCSRSESRPMAVASQPVPNDASPIGMDGVPMFGDRAEAESPFTNRLISNITQHSFTNEGRDFDPDIDARGEMLVFASTRHAEHPDIYMKNVDSTSITQLTSDPADDVQPRFSPDGSRVAFASNRGGTWDIWLINRDGTGLVQLTRDASDELSPCWSPDGAQIAFTVWSGRSNTWEIWTLAIDRPGVRKFLCAGMFPAWSPDGHKLAFQRARQRGSRWFSIWTVDLVGNEARNPTEVAQSDQTACIAPHWSPDGRSIVYCALTRTPSPTEASGSADLWSVAVDTGVRHKLTDGSAAAFNPAWSRSGRVYFVSNRSGAENIWSVPGDMGEAAPVDDPQATRGGTNIDVAGR